MPILIITYKKKCCQKSKKTACFKWTHGLSGNDYIVTTLSNSYLTAQGVIMQSCKAILQF